MTIFSTKDRELLASMMGVLDAGFSPWNQTPGAGAFRLTYGVSGLPWPITGSFGRRLLKRRQIDELARRGILSLTDATPKLVFVKFTDDGEDTVRQLLAQNGLQGAVWLASTVGDRGNGEWVNANDLDEGTHYAEELAYGALVRGWVEGRTINLTMQYRVTPAFLGKRVKIPNVERTVEEVLADKRTAALRAVYLDSLREAVAAWAKRAA